MKRLLDFLWTHFEDHAMLSTLASASYTASPRWLRVGSRLLIFALMIEICLWCVSFGPVPGAVYPVIVLIGIYLSEHLLISMRHAPSWSQTAYKSLVSSDFDKQWDILMSFGGLTLGLTWGGILMLLLVMGCSSWVAMLITVEVMIPLAEIFFHQSPSLLCWLYCLRHHQSWKDE